jgi:hypothetical protein
MRLTTPINPAQLGAVETPSGARTVNLESMMAQLAKRPDRPTLSLADVKISQYTRRLGVTLGYGGLFNFSTDVKSSLYLIEFLATSPEISVPEQENLAVTMGVGVRVILVTTQVEGKGVGNLAGISAMATLSTAHHNYTVDFVGLPGSVRQSFNNAFPIQPTFNLDVMRSFGAAISQLADSMVQLAKKQPEKLEPKMVSLVEFVPEPYSTLGIAASNGYALHRITQNDTYDDAVERLSDRIEAKNRSFPYEQVDPTAVEIIYARIVGGETSKPTTDQKSLAEKIQRLGR